MVLINGALEGVKNLAIGFMLIDMFPKNHSLAIAISTIGTPLGTVTYSEFGILLCNPDNVRPNLIFEEKGVSYNYFDENIAKNILKVFFILGVLNIILGICLQLFCKNPEGIQNHIFDYCPCFKKCVAEKNNDEVQFDGNPDDCNEETIALAQRGIDEETINLAERSIGGGYERSIDEKKIALAERSIDEEKIALAERSIDEEKIALAERSIDEEKASDRFENDPESNQISHNIKIWKTSQFWYIFVILSYQIS